MKRKRILSLLLSSALALSSLTLCQCSSSNSVHNVVINEVVTCNKYSHIASDGTAPDWVELYNSSDKPLNLNGWGLTDDKTEPYKFTFPDITVDSGEYLLIYCSGAEKTDAEDGILRAGFKLSSKGEFLALTDAGGATIQSLDINALGADISYGRKDDGSYAYYNKPTPGTANSGETASEPVFSDSAIDSNIKINEYVSNPRYTITDSDGERYCWVEIINTGSSPVDISGYGLSNDEDNPKKWSFPDITLQPGEIRLVFFSGKDKTDPDGELHTNFKLNSSDTSIILSQELGHSIDEVSIDSSLDKLSAGRSADFSSWVYFETPTPGVSNGTDGVSDISQIDRTKLHDLYISEVKTGKSALADSPDWIELYNAGTASVDLTGYGLSDDSKQPFLYTFPETVIQPGEYLIVYLQYLPDDPLSSLAAETFFNNTDSGNVRFWRDGSGTNKYRWMLYDLDWGLSPSTYTWNYIEEYFNEVGHGIAHGFSTVLPRALLKNSEWKNYFIERYAYHLTHTFSSERTNAILDQMAEEIRPEMERHIARWANTGSPAQEISSPSSMEVWENNLASLKNMLNERIDIVTEDLEQYFGLSDAQMKELGLE